MGGNRTRGLNFVPKDNFTLLKGEDALSEHTFNRHMIRHKFCSKCGAQTFAHGQKDGVELVAINVRALEDVEPWSLTPKRFDGRSF